MGDALTAARRLWCQAPPVNSQCDGCDACGDRCIDGWECTRAEFEALWEYVEAHPEAVRVFRAPKASHWPAETDVRSCPFRDDQRGQCAVYPVRPVICRLFGQVAWLPCPRALLPTPTPETGVEAMRRYAGEERHTFSEWAARPEFAARVAEKLGKP